MYKTILKIDGVMCSMCETPMIENAIKENWRKSYCKCYVC